MNKKKLYVWEAFSLFYIMLVTIYYMISISKLKIAIFPNYRNIIFISVPFFVMAIFFRRYTIKRILIYLVLMVLAVMSVKQSKEYTIFLTVSQTMCAFDIDYRKIIRLILNTEICFTCTNVVLGLIGVIDINTIQYTRMVSLLSKIQRYDMGFTHYNFFGLIIFEITVLYLMLHKKILQLAVKDIIVFLLINLFSYFISGSRTAFLAALIFIIFCNLAKLKGVKDTFVKILCVFTIFFPFICTVGVHFLYEKFNTLFILINQILQTRPLYIERYMLKAGVRPWGADLNEIEDLWGASTEKITGTLDCGFAALTIKFGYIIAICYVILICKLAMELEKRKRYDILICLITISIYGLSENVISFFTYNLGFLFVPIIFNSKSHLLDDQKE